MRLRHPTRRTERMSRMPRKNGLIARRVAAVAKAGYIQERQRRRHGIGNGGRRRRFGGRRRSLQDGGRPVKFHKGQTVGTGVKHSGRVAPQTKLQQQSAGRELGGRGRPDRGGSQRRIQSGGQRCPAFRAVFRHTPPHVRNNHQITFIFRHRIPCGRAGTGLVIRTHQ